jgi:hypothetical protein
MNNRILFILFLFFFSINAFSQKTYFIKYKDNVTSSVIADKISSKKISNNPASVAAQNTNYKVDYFASRFGKYIAPLSRILRVTFNNNQDNSYFLQSVSSDHDVEYVEAAHTYHIESVPNDSLVNQQWALAKIHAFDAWNITQGSDSVFLGIVDTGIDYLHPDLKNKIFINSGETGFDANGKDKRFNGIDDDGNGFIDDYMGFDFVDRVGFPFDSTGGDYLNWDNDPKDENGHGTYIAGIAGAETNNGFGIAGVAPKIKILNIRAFDPTGNGSEDDVAAAILYAVLMKCKVINMSFGDNSFSYVLRDVIRYAYSQNIVLVASSGNSGSDQPHYPSGYSECICVGNSTEDDYVASSSNYGSTLDLVAPGSDILTTAKGDSYAVVSGTSASAPFVSAAAALILSIGNYTNEEVKQILKSTCDDIGEPGWDIHSGAGRLNLFHALSIPAASVIKFNNPRQDFATNGDTLIVNATILSAYFQSFDLYYGTGINPVNWTPLLSNNQYQFSNKDIYKLLLSSLPDTVYNMRLIVHLINGNTLEERVNFYIIRTAPHVDPISAGPAFYGDKITILAALYSSQPCVTRMFYRKSGDSQFRYITLDGFNTNNQFIKNLSYGFIPKELVVPNMNYEVYFEAENLVGLKTTVQNGSAYFNFNTTTNISPVSSTELPYSLPAGEIFKDPLNLSSPDKSEVAIREFSNSKMTNFYKLSNNTFVKFDSLDSKIVKDYGDFNNNQKNDLLTFFVYNSFIYEQNAANSPALNLKFVDSTNKFWPIMAKDIDGDGITEVLEVNSDTTFVVWKVDPNLNLKDSVQLSNFSPSGMAMNLIDSPNAIVTDMFASGKNQIWMADEDGDIFDYKVLGSKSFQKDKVIQTGLTGNSSFLAAGNYLGNGTNVMAVLLHSVTEVDVAPFYLLEFFNFIGDSLHTIYEQAFIDASTEFNSTFQQSDNSIRFADIDNDGKDELILFVFPYSYIFKYDQNTNKIISYKENINSNSIFIGDLNHNNVPEVGFPTSNGIKFFEFANSNKASTPYNLAGYSIDSTHINLTWNGSGDLYYIFQGTDKDHLIKIDSVESRTYVSTVAAAKFYYYTVQSMELSKQFPVSDLSGVLEVYSHTPAKVISVTSSSPTTVIVKLSDRMNTKIEDLRSFILLGVGYPNSISPASEFSYLVTFKNKLPIGLNKLAVNGLNDHYGSPVPQDTISFNVDSVFVSNEFFILNYEILSPYKIKIIFNLDVDYNSASDLNNYVFQPDNTIAKVDFDPSDGKSVYLTLQGKPVGSVGKEYSLKISNLLSSSASGNIKINSGAGSFLVLTSVAQNLSEVYVYPSPAKISGGSGKMTFANLPQRAKIVIFTINGLKIIELEENTGNGGIDYNLRDLNNNIISSGIYIYRIVRLDNANNEVEEKIGKFAVIKE